MSTIRVAVPSKGRLRDSVLDLLDHAGYDLRRFGRSSSAAATAEGIEFIEMRPRDAAAWLHAGRLTAAFISTDTALENDVGDLPALELGFSRSDLVLACREVDGFSTAGELAGKTIATHLPHYTQKWFEDQDIAVEVVAMGGALEGVCAAGMADAIVDLRETGNSLTSNRLQVVAEIANCQAIFSTRNEAPPAIVDLRLRLEAALAARRTQYLLLHIAPEKVDSLSSVFPGLASPTVLPLAGRTDLVAAHLVVERANLWSRLSDLRALGATGIVALPTDAILR